jgi:hypothetical protein
MFIQLSEHATHALRLHHIQAYSYAAPTRLRSSLLEITRIIGFTLKSFGWCIELLDIGGFMGTVPRQESVSNASMHHRELLK